MDEAGAIHQLDLLGALLSGAETLLLVGDHHQLPPQTHKDFSATKRHTYGTSHMEILIERQGYCSLFSLLFSTWNRV